MNANLLKFARAFFVYAEAIGEDVGDVGSFALDQFKKIKDPYMIIDYADNFLDKVESSVGGSSRVVYNLSDKAVLKVAADAGEKGRRQNETEVEVFTNPKTKPIVARVYDFNPDYIWIISEKVKPLYYLQQLVEAGAPFMFLLDNYLYYHTRMIKSYNDYLEFGDEGMKRDFEEGYREMNTIESQMGPKGLVIARALADLVEYSDLLKGDLLEPTQWGLTEDGRLVLLDYGCTRKLYDELYAGQG
jgi:hypothetical protein